MLAGELYGRHAAAGAGILGHGIGQLDLAACAGLGVDVYKRQALFKMQRAHCSAGAAYDYFCDEMENCLPFVFGCTREIRDLAVDARCV